MEHRVLGACRVTEKLNSVESLVPLYRRLRRRGDRGFTLIELSVVVVIVGILSVVAVVGYRRYMLHSKVTEAQAMVSAIRIAQEDYRAETGTYANIGSNYCPTGSGVGNVRYAWTPSCSGGVSTWNLLPVHANGAVLFGYNTTAGTGAFVQPPDTGWVAWGAPTATPWYTISAKCDLNSDGAAYTMLVGSSFDSQIFTDSEGE